MRRQADLFYQRDLWQNKLQRLTERIGPNLTWQRVELPRPVREFNAAAAGTGATV